MRGRILTSAAFATLAKSVMAVFALWTLSYQLVLAARWPAFVSIVIFLVLLAALVGFMAFARRRTESVPPAAESDPRFVIALVLLISILCAAFSLVTNRPDWDDVDFYHRPLTQSHRLDEPFILGDTLHNRPGLPGPTSMHLMASYEMFVAFLARFSGLDGVSAYQNWSGAFASFLFPIVYFLLFRQLGLRPLASLFAVAGAVVFLLFDGNHHASLGNLAFVRFWQGKWILLTLLLPLAVFFALRFWERPAPGAWWVLFMCGVCAVGLAGTGLVLMPVLIFVVSIALLVNGLYEKAGDTRHLIARAIVINLATIYCVALAAAVKSGLIPMLRDFGGSPAAIGHSRSWSWWQNLCLSIGGGWSLLWYGAVLLFGPFLSPSKRAGRLALLWSLAAAAVCFNGVVGPLWLGVMLAVYYRLVFALPITLCAGLVAAGAVSLIRADWKRPSTWAAVACVVILAGLFKAHFQRATFSSANRASLKAPFDYRFDPNVLPFARATAGMLEGRNLLAPDAIVVVQPLLSPSVRLEAERWWVTVSYFYDAGEVEEGLRRMQAQSMVTARRNVEAMFDVDLVKELSTGEEIAPEEALRISIRNGLDAIAVRKMLLPDVRAVLESTDGTWQTAHTGKSFTLLLKQ